MSAPVADWRQQGERSNLLILRLMVWLSLTLGRRFTRLILHAIVLYFLGFAPRARQASRRYLAHALGRSPAWSDIYRHIFAFASTIHDRIYLLNERFNEFSIEVSGGEELLAALADGQGVLLFGAHLGSFEVLRAAGRHLAGHPVSMLMYEENARKINAALHAINPAASQDIVPLGRVDSMLVASERLEAGHLVGVLADRGLSGEAGLSADFLGAPADFPVGPWRMAAMLRRPVFFMTGLYLGGNRYHLHFEPLADFRDVQRAQREAALNSAVHNYAARLAHYCRAAPYNWFNFFDFWKKA
jgi:predicted LPLAT superfamily acyltransferase